MSAQLVLLACLDGVAYAALVFMVAVGLTLIFGVLRILNVAHGSFYAVGAYTAASFGLGIGAAGLSPWLTFPALIVSAALVGGVLGVLIERQLLQRIYVKEEVLQLLVTFAVFMILEDVQRLVWGVQPYFVDTPLRLLGVASVAIGQRVVATADDVLGVHGPEATRHAGRRGRRLARQARALRCEFGTGLESLVRTARRERQKGNRPKRRPRPF